jgi:hypothetical protein
MTQNRGRRIALPPPERVARGLRARLNVTAVLAVVLPLCTVGALALVRPADPVDTRQAPQETALALSVLTCPSSITRTREVSVASATGLEGTVEVAPVGEESPAPLAIEAGRPATSSPGRRAVVVRATDDLAPALLASRDDEGPASAPCVTPRPEQWLTGLGAAARHSSVLELVNPDTGPAVADISLIGSRGPVDAPSLRGITVPGGTSVRVDLAEETPLRGELSAEVVVSRGRLGVFAADSYDQLGRGEAGVDWVAPQEPDTDLLILGLPTGGGSRELVLANDGDDEVRAVVRVVTKDSAFRPEGLQDVRIPPQSVSRVPLSAILGKAVTDGAVGIHVEATQPVTGTLRSFVGGDVSHSVPLTTFVEPTQLVLPDGRARVLLSASVVGSAEVVATRADGSQKARSVDLAPGRTVEVRLPPGAVLVQVTPSVAVRGSVVVVRKGAAVVGLRELVRTDLVPALRPALP